MNLENKLKEVLKLYPHAHKSNIEVALCFWEYVANARGVDFNDWFEMKAIAREYPFESLSRARRKLVKSTSFQLKKEIEFREKYSWGHKKM